MAPAGVPLLVLLLACASPDAVSIEEERQMDAEVARQALAQLPLVRDPTVAAVVSALGQELARRADSTGRAYAFYVVDSPAANAFAVPGGFVFVNRGILELAGDASELAGVVAHEIGHVVERHSLEQMTKAQNANTVVAIVYTLLNRSPGAGERVALRAAGTAWAARHSRAAEREADEVGLVYMTRAGFDPRGMPRLFERLLAEERERPGLVAQWFASHPLTSARIADVDSAVARLPRSALERTARDRPGFARLKARLAELPPPPPDPTRAEPR